MKHLSQGVKVAILVVLVVVGGWVVYSSLGTSPSGSSDYALWGKFRDASGLPQGSRVVVAGLPVGEISDLEIAGRYARVKFQLRDDVPIYDNAVVYKKSSSLLGDYYLELDPGSPESVNAAGVTVQNQRLESGEQVPTVVEATSVDELMRRMDQTLPNVDAVLLSVRDLSEDLRRVVNGPLSSTANRIDDLVQSEAETVSDILQSASVSLERIERITADIRSVTSTADDKVLRILENLDQASAEARTLVVTAREEVEVTGEKVREKLDLVDDVLVNTESITRKIDDDQGTLGRLVNDPTIADNVEEITEDAKGFLGGLFGMQTYVGLRSEYNVFARLARHYVSIELHTRPDKYYLIEFERGPRGGFPEVTLVYDPTIDRDQWIRRATIQDETRYTFQIAKRLGWATFRYGMKESTGGVGMDLERRWWERSLRFSVDVFDASFDQLPRLKMSGAFEVFRNLYILGGVDEALNEPDELVIDTGNFDIPISFEKFRFGRDYFLGAMLRFNDEDLAALLTVGGSAIAGATE